MLIRFSVKNVLSFNDDVRDNNGNDTVQFSMNAGNVRTFPEHVNKTRNNKILKFAAIYGANASGKSNIIKAMSLMKSIVINGHLDESQTDSYCKVSSKNKNKPSYFEMEIELNGEYYAYGFECILSKLTIISEWLVKLNKSSESVIFERDVNSKRFVDGLKNDSINLYYNGIRSDQNILFLNEMNRNKRDFFKDNPKTAIYKKIFDWLCISLDINFANNSISGYKYLLEDDNFSKITSLLQTFGTGITDFKLEEIPKLQFFDKIPQQIRNSFQKDFDHFMHFAKQKNEKSYLNLSIDHCFYSVKIEKDRDEPVFRELKFKHNNSDSIFEVKEESDGTIRLLDLLEILLTKEKNKVFVIDEIDRCLHPNLTYRFIQTYLESLEKRNIQLIITSHESRILDLQLLRRDEVCFVKKNNKGESKIYSLDDYKTRFDQKLDKAYLDGRYDAVPEFGPIIANLNEDCEK
jgi:AAA15 family ATPase/GTPase